ncbi:MAG: tRNA glutamyl-Q(34) synthetase GluQRS [Pacificimonas sp.]|jgi:glutamyl-Q tRNA(Asp) synthetase|nr:tRNA glutamyl-Q(34) synthetase GluQRS [Pacificimonas sp.]
MAVIRFAPSPTGRLHRGHAYAALLVELWAERAGLTVKLRIEDLDPQRSRPEFVDAIYDDLTWLGFTWTGEPMRQSGRAEAYADALAALADLGVTYPCFCSRKDMAEAIAAPHGPDGATYPGTCRDLAAEEAKRRSETEPFAVRIDALKAADLAGHLNYTERGERRMAHPALLGDVVLARKDAAASYHLASVVDDAAQGVDHILRGEDLLPSVHVHRLLQALLGLPEPRYRHHALVLGDDGQRLAKRNGARPLADLRAAGVAPDALRCDLTALAKANRDL